MKKILLTIVLLTGFLYPQDYVLKDSSETAMARLQQMAHEIDSSITANLTSKVSQTEFDLFKAAMYDSIASLRAGIGTNTTKIDSPAVPTNLSASAGTGTTATITLTWTQSGSFDSVVVYRSDNGGLAYSRIGKVDSGATQTYADLNIPADQTKWYYLKAVNGGIYSNQTLPVNATVTNTVSLYTFYVAKANAGNGSGSSWANAKSFASLNGTWNTFIQPGTTVYLDGGTDSVVYDCNQYNLNTRGTVALPIIVTVGVDAGHNGRAIFRNTSSNYIGMALSAIINTTFYDLEWKGGMTATGETWMVDFSGNVQNVTFSYCTFTLNYSCGVGTNSNGSSDNVRFLHCTSLNNLDTGTNSSADQFWLGGPNHKNWEFAYCNIINSNPKTGAVVASAHRDLMQCEWNWGRGGTFRVHHNFFDDRSAGAAGACIESEHLEGNWLIYNNVFKTNSTGANGTGHFSTLSLTANYGAVSSNSIEVYNNTFYCNTRWGRSPSFLGWSNLTFKNNIVYMSNANNTWFIMSIDDFTWDGNISSDYNQFYNINSDYIANESGSDWTWNQWRAAGYDAHSTHNTDTPTFVDANGLSGTDYALQAGSDGIDQGTTISTVTDDYSGTSRPQGSAYDVGAFER